MQPRPHRFLNSGMLQGNKTRNWVVRECIQYLRDLCTINHGVMGKKIYGMNAIITVRTHSHIKDFHPLKEGDIEIMREMMRSGYLQQELSLIY